MRLTARNGVSSGEPVIGPPAGATSAVDGPDGAPCGEVIASVAVPDPDRVHVPGRPVPEEQLRRRGVTQRGMPRATVGLNLNVVVPESGGVRLERGVVAGPGPEGGRPGQ